MIEALNSIFACIVISPRNFSITVVNNNSIYKSTTKQTADEITFLLKQFDCNTYHIGFIALDYTPLMIINHISSQMPDKNTFFYFLTKPQIKNYAPKYISNNTQYSLNGALFIKDNFKDLKPWDKLRYFPLRLLTRNLLHLYKISKQSKNNAIYLSTLRFSELTNSINKKRQRLISRVESKSFINFLISNYTLEDFATLSYEELLSIFPEHTSYSQKKINEILANMRNFSKSSYKYTNSINNALVINLSSSMTLAYLVRNHIQNYSKIIEKYSIFLDDDSFNVITSIPGITKVQAAIILAELNTISDFSSHKSLANYAGFGQSKRYNPYLRNILLSTTKNVIKCDKTFYEYYHKHNLQGTLNTRRALIVTARKLIRVMYTLLTKNILYDSSKPKQKEQIQIEKGLQENFFIGKNKKIIDILGEKKIST